MTIADEKTTNNTKPIFNVEKIRQDFPALHQSVHGKPLAYLDNAATSQKPEKVIKSIDDYYRRYNSNVHRGIHHLSEKATKAYEDARETVRRFINAKETREIVFVRGTTEAINLVAQTYGRANLQAGDEIILSEMEHHSNIVPWQMLQDQLGVIIKVIPMNDKGELLLEKYNKLFSQRTKLVCLIHASNALGTVNPIKTMIATAKQHNVPVLIDGAQATPHFDIDVQALDCDFYAFSGHKMYGPTGIGALYAKAELLETMPPYQGGGEMIKMVSFDRTVYNEIPHKFEAGTPNIAGAIGLAAAIDYLDDISLKNIANYEQDLLNYASTALSSIQGLRIIGTAEDKTSIVSFLLENIHAHDIGTILDRQGIAVRSGHHCAMPVMQHFNVPATTRASFAFYNTREEINRLVTAIEHVKKVFA